MAQIGDIIEIGDSREFEIINDNDAEGSYNSKSIICVLFPRSQHLRNSMGARRASENDLV